MADLKVDKHKWMPDFPDETTITHKKGQDEFTITLKKGEDIEIEHDWDYGYGGRGCERMSVPVELLKDLIKDLGM